MSATSRLCCVGMAIGLSACGGEFEPWLDEPGTDNLPLTAFCTATVVGVGERDVETDYLPHVVTCENGGAPFESLKAQAVAARTFLYYKLIHGGSIRDGTSDQVYSCNAQPGDAQIRAVRETAGQYLAFGSTVLCSFFVAGAHQSPPECRGNTSDSTNTERYVTYNWGLSGDNIHQSTLGWVDSGNNANRGCFSQWGSRCLADDGWVYTDMLKFYYGMDIGLHTATGDCVQPPAPANSAPRGYLDSADCERIAGWAQDPDAAAAAIKVEVFVDGRPGDAGVRKLSRQADDARDDLCSAIGSCNHGYAIATPTSLRDGQQHTLRAYALDSANGTAAELSGSPKSITCIPPPPPLSAAQGVRRWIVDPQSLTSWDLSWWDVARLADDVVDGYRIGPPMPAQPALVKADDGTLEIWSLDTGVRRHVPGPQAFAAWGFSADAVGTMPAAALYAIPIGAPLPAAPFAMQGSGPEVYVLDAAACMGAPDEPDAGSPAETDAGGTNEIDAGTVAGTDAGAPDPTAGSAEGVDESGPERVEIGLAPVGCAASAPLAASPLAGLALLALLLRRRSRS